MSRGNPNSPWNIFLNGFKNAMKSCGFIRSKPSYPIELYQWICMDDSDVCAECLERSSWEPMDIADWMETGLPRTPEAETTCGENCRCELILYKTASHRL